MNIIFSILFVVVVLYFVAMICYLKAMDKRGDT